MGKKTGRKLFLSGLLIGISLLFKQVVVPLIVLISLYLFIKEKNGRKMLSFWSGIGIPVAILSIYIFSIGVLSDFKKRYAKKDALWWSYYNTPTPTKRRVYEALVGRYL